MQKFFANEEDVLVSPQLLRAKMSKCSNLFTFHPDLKGPLVLYPKDERIIIVDGEEKDEL